jgi:hypothetical protein
MSRWFIHSTLVINERRILSLMLKPDKKKACVKSRLPLGGHAHAPPALTCNSFGQQGQESGFPLASLTVAHC